MLFCAPRHVVLLIQSPIMTDSVLCTLTCSINYSVSHHDGCCLVHPDMWYQLNAIRHHDGCRLVHPAKWDHFFNAIRHHDGCRLVHPPKWDIGQFRGAFVTDADLCIPSAIHSIYQSIHIYDGFRLMNPVFIIIHIHSVFKSHISIPYSLSYYLFKDILNLCTYFIYSFTYSFHILIHILIHVYSFVYSFMYSFHILIHVYSFIYSFTYSFHILIHILIHVLISYTHSYTHSHTHSCAHFI